jgi:Zn-finger nucleic acid-binding protein
MQCMNCQRPLLNIEESHFFRHLTYDTCDKCGGMWLDKGELNKIALQTPGSVEACSVETLHAELKISPHSYEPFPPKCLRCQDQAMVKMHFMGEARILLDYCDKCGGIWVDGGELTKINQYIHWFDKKAKPSKFGRFLHHAHSTFFHRIDVTAPFEQDELKSGDVK